jgi:hypothetical protein
MFNLQTTQLSKSLDTALLVFCVVNLLQITIEITYFKYYLEKGINLEQRIKLPELLRFKDYIKYIMLSVCCGGVTLSLALTLFTVQPCHLTQYERDNGKECVSCAFVLGDACEMCTGPKECTKCKPGHFLIDGQCTRCSDKFRDCGICD